MRYLTISPAKIAICQARKIMTTKTVCRLSGISESNMSTILKNRRVTPATAGKIAKALGVDVTEILVQPMDVHLKLDGEEIAQATREALEGFKKGDNNV